MFFFKILSVKLTEAEFYREWNWSAGYYPRPSCSQWCTDCIPEIWRW